MANGQDSHLFAHDPIDGPIFANEELAKVYIPNLRHNSATVGEIDEPFGGIEEPINPGLRRHGAILTNIVRRFSGSLDGER